MFGLGKSGMSLGGMAKAARGLSNAMDAGIDALVEAYDIPREEARELFTRAVQKSLEEDCGESLMD